MMRIHSRSAVNSRTTALLPATSVRQSSAKSKLQTVTLLTPNMTLDFVNKLQQSKPLTGASDNVTSQRELVRVYYKNFEVQVQVEYSEIVRTIIQFFACLQTTFYVHVFNCWHFLRHGFHAEYSAFSLLCQFVAQLDPWLLYLFDVTTSIVLGCTQRLS